VRTIAAAITQPLEGYTRTLKPSLFVVGVVLDVVVAGGCLRRQIVLEFDVLVAVLLRHLRDVSEPLQLVVAALVVSAHGGPFSVIVDKRPSDDLAAWPVLLRDTATVELGALNSRAGVSLDQVTGIV
jgi:hypothetical protein